MITPGFKGAVFIDRDGTLIEEVSYLKNKKDVVLIDGVGESIHKLNKFNIPVIVVTNQGGIGLKYLTWSDYYDIERHIDYLLKEYDAHITRTYKCPFHPNAELLYKHNNHHNRKPNPGMLLEASAIHNIDLSKSWMIGDRETDVMAGINAGCKTILVRTGCGSSVKNTKADLVFSDLTIALNHILEFNSV